jgi:ORF3
MKKLLKWLFVKEQAETVEVPAWTFEKNASEPSRDRYNKTHGLGETLI